MLLMILVGDDGRYIELHAVQVELAAAAGNFPLHGRAEIVDVELCDLEQRVNNGRHVCWVAAPDGAQMELIEKV